MDKISSNLWITLLAVQRDACSSSGDSPSGERLRWGWKALQHSFIALRALLLLFLLLHPLLKLIFHRLLILHPHLSGICLIASFRSTLGIHGLSSLSHGPQTGNFLLRRALTKQCNSGLPSEVRVPRISTLTEGILTRYQQLCGHPMGSELLPAE